jgi:hypothetical protein
MMLHEFTLVLSGIDEFTNKEEDALYEAGFDDSLLTYMDGKPCIEVNHRFAEDMEAVILSAIADVESTGLKVERVKSPWLDALHRINAGLATANGA